MRSLFLLLLSATVAFVPVVQAEACFCAGSAELRAANAGGHQEATCCCGDDSVCCCTDCDAHDGDRRESKSGRVADCVCTKTQPQSAPAQSDDIALTEALAQVVLPLAAMPQRAPCLAATQRCDLRPTFQTPLLV